jgi:hypothetical protein
MTSTKKGPLCGFIGISSAESDEEDLTSSDETSVSKPEHNKSLVSPMIRKSV